MNDQVPDTDTTTPADAPVAVIPPRVLSPMEPTFKISNDEWLQIARSLEQHHAVFYKVWEMGKPIFSNYIDTACVQFNHIGQYVLFHFNPDFWKRLDFYTRRFVICHEALHVILNHGVRMKDSPFRQACNAALDVVVNHTLLRDFGFDRKRIDATMKPILYDMALEEAGGDASKVDPEKCSLCWVDTVFKPTPTRPAIPSDDQSFEYYYDLFEKMTIQIKGFGRGQGGAGGGQGQGEGGEGSGQSGDDGQGGKWFTLDDHETMTGEGGEFEKIIKAIDEQLNNEEKASIQDMLQKHTQQGKDGNQPGGKMAGTGTGGLWHFVNPGQRKKKAKWETIIKKWSKRYLKPIDHDQEQWARLNRRMVMLPRTMFLPSDMEVEDEKQEKQRIPVYFFLDTSGSCWDLKDRFFAAVETLPEKRFDVRLFCFDTVVKETTLASRKVYGGGGTAFDIIEQFIQNEANRERAGKYPEAVFVMTDGYGNRVQPAKPEKWYWFLTGGRTGAIDMMKSHYAPETCNYYDLAEFE